MTVDSAWLVLGGLHHLNGSAPVSGTDPVVVVPLGAAPHEHFPQNTVVLDWAGLGEVELRGRGAGRAALAKVHGADLFPDMLPGPVLTELAGGGPGPLVPLFHVAVRHTDEGARAHVHGQIRFTAEDACFIRITPEPLAVSAVEELDWLPEAVRLHAEKALFLNNHQRYYRKCFAGQEMEYKYTLRPPVDIWTATVELYRRLRAGGLPGYVMEYRDEFQAWDYTNHLYQVTAPEPDRGYVSFIPTTDGRNLVKRKWYTADTFSRRESHTYGVDAEDGFDAYVRDELKVVSTRLPSFRRVRYDVNFESTRTGHVYGIFFDHVSLIDAPDVVLSQCELEYLRSRTAVEPDAGAVLTEIDEIARWLEAYLGEHGLNNERGYYSKLTFLLDSVAARPELAAVVAR
ncbi:MULTISPECIES: hypothetical protein [unclassified Streptomyces]|uniref:hypothetical protein n=1 Tax=unclassified Streptomyces TaxID=2593676 RepID=UPI002E2DD411|nr:hypothetical protein [Streptomyces sp. NBC_00223]